MVVPVGVTSYYLPRIYFLAGLEKAPVRQFNEIMFFIQAAVWGLTFSQICQYFFNYMDDPCALKVFAGLLWCLDAAHQFLTTYIVTSIFLNGRIVNMFSTWDLLFFNLAFFSIALVSVMGQSFYIYQSYRVSSKTGYLRGRRSLLLPMILAPFILFQFVLPSVLFHNTTSFAGVDFYKPSESVIDKFRLQQDILQATLSVNTGVNLVIFLALAFHLRRLYFGPAQSLTFERELSLLWRVSLFTVNTGFWVLLYSALSLIAFCLLRVNSTYIVLHFHCLSAFYCTSILANLNARDYLRPTGDHAYLPAPKKRSIPGLTGVQINTIRLEPLDFRRTRDGEKSIEIMSANSLTPSSETKSFSTEEMKIEVDEK
ncbi:hypothetical protein CVT26_006548 [Gymnopilus dilepis]|uniref:DUF6534 domain-containing protein n=1 Tax=Gymnopilus dilepis TaxID=231916 RepID=A0A409W612_9AGAR|nr:hypothetical protein CVT26_006548 [Gymnopilus dilepis]